ncbi:LysR substrate-binding domain-containing protein [Spirillospora sp. NPDC047279]|uniref:LysR family transcriptional regulator n=1 Tax=Spirillospora sp. NPDC047279 TaxID=3155478 RepID=UPI0033CFD6CF
MLDVGRLQILVHLSVEGTIARTADVLGFTPSAVSQQLSKLERELDVTLAIRTRTGVRLTEEGNVLVEQVKPVLAQFAAVERKVRDIARQGAGQIRLGSFSSGALALVAPAIGQVRERHPGLRMSLVDVEPPGGLDALRDGRLDLLISHTYPGTRTPELDGLVRIDLLRDPLVAVVPAGWASRGDRLSITELAEMPLVCGGPGDANRTALDRAFFRYDLTPRVEFETRSYAVSLALAAAEAGATVMPRSTVRDPPHTVEVMTLEPIEVRSIFCLHRATSREDSIRTFIERFTEICDELHAEWRDVV